MADREPLVAPSAPAASEPGVPDESLGEVARHARVMHHRQIIRRAIVGALIVGLLVAIGVVAIPVVKQLTTHWSLGGAGFVVDWQVDGDNWTSGGTTAVTSKGHSWLKPSRDPDLQLLPLLWNLESLNLTECDITEQGLAPLARLTQLRELSLVNLHHIRYGSGPPGLSDACLIPLQRLTSLQSMNLSGNRITDSGLALLSGLTNLETLDLDATDVTDSGLVQLQSLKQLKVLSLAGTKVTPQGVKALQSAMPGLEINTDMEPTLAEKVANWRRQRQ